MKKQTYKFSNSSVDYWLDGSFNQLATITDPASTFIVTDENLAAAHGKKFRKWKTIVIKAGEEHKTQQTVDGLLQELIESGADRHSTLVGIGGGVITDLSGYAASIYMRGIRAGFIPTSILAMVDASIGGKNGVDVGLYKNMVGVIRQPSFILHDLSLLGSLPQNEWENGFAEIIKHACIRDAAMFGELEKRSLAYFRRNRKELAGLIRRNALIKTKLVQQDEFEKGDRKLLNFGHTLGHAIENMYSFSHGQAVAIGMNYASRFSEQLAGFKQAERVAELIARYGLPVKADFDRAKAFEILQKDKKKVKTSISYVLLEKIGRGVIKSLPLSELEKLIHQL